MYEYICLIRIYFEDSNMKKEKKIRIIEKEFLYLTPYYAFHLMMF